MSTAPPKPLVQIETIAQQAAIRAALHYLPQRLYDVLVAAYGLDGQPARSLADLARD